MKIKKANIWNDFDSLDIICITTNSILKKNGELVMGAGFAKQALNVSNGLAKDFGDKIKLKNLNGGFYGIIPSECGKYLTFQTKLHWMDDSPLKVVTESCLMLKRFSDKNSDKIIGLPYPAINNGGRTKSEIFPIIEILPDNVIVYELS